MAVGKHLRANFTHLASWSGKHLWTQKISHLHRILESISKTTPAQAATTPNTIFITLYFDEILPHLKKAELQWEEWEFID